VPLAFPLGYLYLRRIALCDFVTRLTLFPPMGAVWLDPDTCWRVWEFSHTATYYLRHDILMPAFRRNSYGAPLM